MKLWPFFVRYFVVKMVLQLLWGLRTYLHTHEFVYTFLNIGALVFFNVKCLSS